MMLRRLKDLQKQQFVNIPVPTSFADITNLKEGSVQFQQPVKEPDPISSGLKGRGDTSEHIFAVPESPAKKCNGDVKQLEVGSPPGSREGRTSANSSPRGSPRAKLFHVPEGE